MTAPPGRVAVIGAGTALLVGELAASGLVVTAIDIAETAVERLREHLAGVTNVEYQLADARSVRLEKQVETWHDRAVFHFLTEPADQQAYVARAAGAVQPGGHVVMATFAPDGPVECSGLPVVRHSEASLRAVFSPQFELVEIFEADHYTPWATAQRFTHAVLRRTEVDDTERGR